MICRSFLVDRIQLQQVIINLIMNAIEAMSEMSQARRELVIASVKDGSNGVLVAVRDSGQGLDPKAPDHLFDAFYTTKPEGMGMGLPISRTIIEAHGGRLWATPKSSRSHIPVQPADRRRIGCYLMKEEQPVVFVVDDDASVRDALEDLLRSVGLGVTSFGSAQEFLASKRPDAPGCIVLDVRLPGASGLEFQRELMKSSIQLPIIFISGHGDIPMSVRAMKSGAIEFLTKPLREQKLLDAVQAGIERDRARRQEAKLVDELRERLNSLTLREQEVLPLVITGRPNKQIAAQLELSEMTVKVHRSQIMRKMRAKSLVDLVRMADQLGVSTRKS